MKDNKEFIDGIYKKYEESKSKEKVGSSSFNKNLPKILSIAAMLLIICYSFAMNKNIISPESSIPSIQTEKISLKTIDTKEKFYELITSNNNLTDMNFAGNSVLESTITDSVSKAETSDYSKTNTQVANVDEADIVKTDGNYIFSISNNKIVIIDIKDEMKEIAKIDYENTDNYPEEIYITQNKLISICNTTKYLDVTKNIYETTDSIYVEGVRNKTSVIVYDIVDTANPKETRRVEIDGYYVSSRMIDNNIYFVTNKYINYSPILRNSLEELKIENYEPELTDTASSNTIKRIGLDRIYYFDDIQDANYLLMTGFNVEENEEADVKTFLGAGETVYSSMKNMYIAKTKGVYDINTYEQLNGVTKILKFSLNNGKINFVAEADINGSINNQFSMDENEGGYFRIGTTVGSLWNLTDRTSNSVYVLDKDLKEVGKLEGLAKGEKIYSVRYVEDKAYIVTFKQVDPLFVIDLSEPTQPKVLGELKIPGYSTYLHPYDDTHIIGFGYDTTANGETIRTNGLKMAMFDITDLANPKEMFKVNIGNRYTSSELAYNHKALMYSKEKNIIGFPISSYTNGGSISKAQVYEINLISGFKLKGEIAHNTNDYTNTIKRIIYANDNYYTISENLIKSTNMYTFSENGKLEIK